MAAVTFPSQHRSRLPPQTASRPYFARSSPNRFHHLHRSSADTGFMPTAAVLRLLRTRLMFLAVTVGTSTWKLTEEELMRQCEIDSFKASGTGGQHRNKHEFSIRLKHVPTRIIAQAVEDRSQHKNHATALLRRAGSFGPERCFPNSCSVI